MGSVRLEFKIGSGTRCVQSNGAIGGGSAATANPHRTGWIEGVTMEDPEVPFVNWRRRIALSVFGVALTAFLCLELLPSAAPYRSQLNRYVPTLGHLRSVVVEWIESSAGLNESGRFKVMVIDDQFEGRQQVGVVNFVTSNGVSVEGRMSCKSSRKPTGRELIDAFSGLNDKMAEAFSTDARSGCPVGFSCKADLQLSFFRGEEGVALTKVAAGGREFPSTVYFLKNVGTGTVGKYKASLYRDGGTEYINSILIDAPTSGESLSTLLYRFKAQGVVDPIDIELDFSQPALSGFADYCEQLAGGRKSGARKTSRVPSLGSPPTSHERQIAIRAAKQFDKEYGIGGVAGVRSEVQSCYDVLLREKSEDQAMYCFMMDHLLDLRDKYVSSEVGMPQQEENNSSSVKSRLCDGLKHILDSEKECTVRVSRWSEVIERIYEGN